VPYQVELAPAAQRDFRRLPREIQARLAPLIQSLAESPRPSGVRKLHGEESTWRVRAGPYRIVYDVYDDRALVVVLKVTRRNETTYRR
jgi:mRNA interferase RelE/StbE